VCGIAAIFIMIKVPFKNKTVKGLLALAYARPQGGVIFTYIALQPAYHLVALPAAVA
jgi:hypothetical protein